MNRRWIIIINLMGALSMCLVMWIKSGNWAESSLSLLTFLIVTIHVWLNEKSVIDSTEKSIIDLKIVISQITSVLRSFISSNKLNSSDKASLPKAFWWVKFSMLIVPSDKLEDFLMGLDERYPTILKRVGSQWGEIVYRKEILFFVAGFLVNRIYKIILAVTKLFKIWT